MLITIDLFIRIMNVNDKNAFSKEKAFLISCRK